MISNVFVYSDISTPKFLTHIKEVAIQILLNLDDEQLSAIFQTDKYAAALSIDDYFWYLRIKMIYISDLSHINGTRSYREIYKSLRKHKGENLLRYALIHGYLPIIQYLIESSSFTQIEPNSTIAFMC